MKRQAIAGRLALSLAQPFSFAQTAGLQPGQVPKASPPKASSGLHAYWSQYSNGNWNPVDTTAAKQQAQQNLQNARQNRQPIQPQNLAELK